MKKSKAIIATACIAAVFMSTNVYANNGNGADTSATGNEQRATYPLIKTVTESGYYDENQVNEKEPDYTVVNHFDENGYLKTMDYSDSDGERTISFDWKFDSDGAPVGIAYTSSDGDEDMFEFTVSMEDGHYLYVLNEDDIDMFTFNYLFYFQRPIDLEDISFALKIDYFDFVDTYFLHQWDLNGYASTFSTKVYNSEGFQEAYYTYSHDEKGYVAYEDSALLGGEIRTNYEYDGYLNTAYTVNDVRQTIKYDMIQDDEIKLWHRQAGDDELYDADDTGALYYSFGNDEFYYSVETGLLMKSVDYYHFDSDLGNYNITYTYEYY